MIINYTIFDKEYQEDFPAITTCRDHEYIYRTSPKLEYSDIDFTDPNPNDGTFEYILNLNFVVRKNGGVMLITLHNPTARSLGPKKIAVFRGAAPDELVEPIAQSLIYRYLLG